jgi:chlorite dismutase
MNPRLFTFVGGNAGAWAVIRNTARIGEPLPQVKRLEIVNAAMSALPGGARWMLRGVTSNERYATRAEKDQLVAKQVAIGRPGATLAALIPIRKNARWWALTQDERRAIFEDRSHHVQTGLKYLPAVARRLHHCRDLGEREPFDFLTLFDYAKADANAFEDMVAELRATEEWKFVEREIDLRLVRGEG